MTTKTASTENERDEASTFRIHTGRFVRGARLQAALAKVAEDWRQLAHTIRSEDAYAPHVTEDQKRDALRGMLLQADEIERGNVVSFAIWQRVNTQLTGDCVPLFGPTPRRRKVSGFSALRVDDMSRPAGADLPSRIRAAYLAVTGGQMNTRALLKDLRPHLSDVSRADQDAAMLAMQREGNAILFRQDNGAALTAADHAAALHLCGEPRHILWIVA